MTCHCTRLNDSRAHTTAHARTEQWNKALPESTGCRVTNSTIHMSEHSIITFHACSKPGAKYSSLEEEEEELASSSREDRHTLVVAPRCGRGRLAKRPQEDGWRRQPRGWSPPGWPSSAASWLTSMSVDFAPPSCRRPPCQAHLSRK